MRATGIVLALAIAGCGRISFDPVGGVDIVDGQCISHDKHAPSRLVDDHTDLTLCAGTSYLSLSADAGSQAVLTLGNTNVPRNTLSISFGDPGGVEIAGPVWSTDYLLAGGFVRTTGDQLLAIESDGDAVATASVLRLPTNGPVFYLAPDGDDSGDGSNAQPWRSWAYAFTQLHAQDTLIVKDGTWEGGAHPSCDLGTANQGSIHILAQHPRQAHIHSNGTEPALLIEGCANWWVDGLHLSNEDAPGSQNGSTLAVDDSPNFVGVNLLVEHPNACANNPAVGIGGLNGGSTNAVLADSEIYDFHRSAVLAADTQGITVRRVYVNSRDGADLDASVCGTAFTSSYPSRGDTAFDCFNYVTAPSCSFGDIIAEDVGEGFEAGEPQMFTLAHAMVRDAAIGFRIASNVGVQVPAVRAVSDMLCVNCDVGIWNRGQFATLTHGAYYDGTARFDASYGIGVDADQAGLGGGTFDISNTVAVNNASSGFTIAGMTTWQIRNSAAAGNPTNFIAGDDPADNSGNVRLSSETAPTLLGDRDGSCLVYTPSASSAATAGEGGAPLGPQIIERVDDDALFGREKLWNQHTGAFPCGATVTGVNDIPGKSCFDVHTRLRVGVAGCAIP